MIDSLQHFAVADLVPYGRNARTHSKEQVQEIAASIKEFGFTNPVLVDESKGVIAGHGRLEAAKLLGLEQVPCITLRGLTDAQRRAYILADNKIALNAGWNEELLKLEFEELALTGIDLELTGFKEHEIAELTAEAEAVASFGPNESKLLNKAWLDLYEEWKPIVASAIERGYLTPEITRKTLPVHFLLARFGRKEIPRTAALAFCIHRLRVASAKYSLMDLFTTDQEPGIEERLRWTCIEEPSLDKLLSSNLPIRGSRIPGDFPASLARDLIDEFVPKGSAGWVLDPCQGWGGRALGFLLSKRGRRYEAYDVDPLTVAGVRDMVDALLPYAQKGKATAHHLQPFEQAQIESSFDFALTSPPYYDVEKYEGEGQSWKQYADFDGWVDGFYRPMLEKVCASLGKGRHFALQVGSQRYPLTDLAIEIGKAVGFKHVETRGTGMVNNRTGTDEDEGEVTVILRKL